MKFKTALVGFSMWNAALFGETADKSHYTLWNPTPRELMREMSTDRPDKTESPYTVDAGHFQIEADLVSYGIDRHNTDFSGTDVENWNVFHANYKIGLCNNSDLQLVFPAYQFSRIKDRTTGRVSRDEGIGDLTTRLKVNLWGNDGGATAFAVMPFVKVPTAADGLGNDAVEGGVILPLAIALPHDWSMGIMWEVDFAEDTDGSGYHPEFIQTLTFSRDIIGALAGYVEFFSAVSAEQDTDWVGTFDMGFTYAITDDVQLDAGVNFGVTRSADDYNPFLGLSWRF